MDYSIRACFKIIEKHFVSLNIHRNIAMYI